MSSVIGSLRKIISKNNDALTVFVFMFAVFTYVMFGMGEYNSDLPAHARIAKQNLEERHIFSNNFLMYLLVNIMSLFSGKLFLIRWALVLLIAMANTTKYVLVRDEFSSFCDRRLSQTASTALLFVYIIPIVFFLIILKHLGILIKCGVWNWYLGYYVPNVWHNSTILCMMPFAIITYILSVRQFDSFDQKRNGFITFYIVLGTLVKPSFFFVYVAAYPICMLVRYGLSEEFFRSLIPILAGSICVLYEFITIYANGDAGGDGVVISLKPLFTMDFWKSHALGLVVSLAFPLFFCIFFAKESFCDWEFWFVLIMLVMALGISWCCHETGQRAMHGNFGWQVVTAMWFVYYYILKSLLRIKKYGWGVKPKVKFFIFLYGAHVGMGILYLGKYIVTCGYE